MEEANEYSVCIQLNPGNSNCQGKLKLLRLIGVSSYRGFEQKENKHLIKVVLCLQCFIVRFLAMQEHKNKKTKQNKSMKTTSNIK